MQRDAILSEIRKFAAANGGRAPGKAVFENETGIREASWRGRYWARWSDLVREAGFAPGEMNQALGADFLLKRLAELTRELGRIPTMAEMRMKKLEDSSFPNSKVYERLGAKQVRDGLLGRFVSANPQFEDVAALVPSMQENAAADVPPAVEELVEGHVYMLKLGKHFKIGRTSAVPRRHREIALELPERPDVVHTIRTDDPEGIETYWHRRFAAKRTNGEWFALSSEDIRAFRRRKFM